MFHITNLVETVNELRRERGDILTKEMFDPDHGPLTQEEEDICQACFAAEEALTRVISLARSPRPAYCCPHGIDLREGCCGPCGVKMPNDREIQLSNDTIPF